MAGRQKTDETVEDEMQKLETSLQLLVFNP